MFENKNKKPFYDNEYRYSVNLIEKDAIDMLLRECQQAVGKTSVNGH